MTILFQSAQFILTPQYYPLPTTRFYLELTHPQGNVPLNLLPQKCGLQYIRSSATFTFRWHLKKHLSHEQDI